MDNIPSAIRQKIEGRPSLDEKSSTRVAELTCGRLADISLLVGCREKSEVIIFCCDHGVARRGVTKLPPDYAKQKYCELVAGIGIAFQLGKAFSVPVHAIDCSMGSPSRDICDEDAMTQLELQKSLVLGWDQACGSDCELIGIGELGAGNTTSAAALASIFLNEPPADCVGTGSGIETSQIPEKLRAVEIALERVEGKCESTTDALRRLGGKEIVAMCGAILGAHSCGKLVVLDGFVTCVAALAAVRIWPESRNSLICCTTTDEKGQALAVRRLGLSPFMNIGHTCGQGFGSFFGLEFCRSSRYL
ncbi:MAG: hypothetical protein CFE44_13850 [Burkholderiales bacterium PBB4]|nr:MAG: hypothetical protein CFE44_13850 [Burkholderiales bacterium PBB4]